MSSDVHTLDPGGGGGLRAGERTNQEITSSAVNCPNCSAPMDHVPVAGIYGPDIELDVCYACHVLWLDKRESLHLSPSGTLALFRLLHQHRDDPRHAIGGRTSCPRCGARLALQHDIGKGGRFSYYSCPSRHGRLTPFSEFLKEKQFVRELSPAEKSRLRVQLKQVQCSGCGAPVELARGFACEHCGSPISVLDAEAVEKTLRDLGEADAARSEDAEGKQARARALAAMEAMRTDPQDYWGAEAKGRSAASGILNADLLTASIAALFKAF